MSNHAFYYATDKQGKSIFMLIFIQLTKISFACSKLYNVSDIDIKLPSTSLRNTQYSFSDLIIVNLFPKLD